MIRLTLSGIAILFCLKMCSQNSAEIDTPNNSYLTFYQKQGLDINYVYLNDGTIHDYSGNWDLNGDGEADSIKFVGNGGAHLYYCLSIKLTGKKKPIYFPKLCLDLAIFTPMLLPGTDDSHTRFTIGDFNGNGILDIGIANYKYGGSKVHTVVYYKRGKLLTKNYYKASL